MAKKLDSSVRDLMLRQAQHEEFLTLSLSKGELAFTPLLLSFPRKRESNFFTEDRSWIPFPRSA
ncbi:MAG: hypothetical protein BGN82_01625 [Alphaproteobacteria bacterium 65-7]|nr:MAG: hypothetical protein BGN82_01625 [Alphaproteobacteria bacterium 65-7]